MCHMYLPILSVYIFGRSIWAAPASSGVFGLPDVKFGGRYSLDVTVLTRDEGISSSKRSDVGYSVQGQLSLEYLHKNLLLAKLESLKLHIPSRKAPTPNEFVFHTSKLDELENGPFLVHLEGGKVTKVLVAELELPPIVKLKKGVASLLQFQHKSSVIDDESDVRGKCKTIYAEDSNSIAIKKLDCQWPHEISTPSELWGNKLETSMTGRVVLTNQKTVQSSEAVDFISSRSSLASFASVSLESKIKIELLDAEVKKDRLSTADIESVIDEATRTLGIKFTSLDLTPEEVQPETNIMKFADVVNKFSKSLKSSELGTTKSAWALVKSIRSIKNTKAEDLYAVLSSKKYQKIRHQLIDIFGAVQTNATHSAALKFLKMNTEKMDLDLCERYLWAMSTSPNIKRHVIQEIYDLVKTAEHPNDKLWQTLLLTLPAMAYKYNERCNFCDQELIEETANFLNESLSSCSEGDVDCQMIHLRGLVNIPTGLMKGTLLEKALSSKGRTGVLALKFLEKLGPNEWDSNVIRGAEQIYLGNITYDSSARCIALDILLKSNPTDTLLHRIISVLKQPHSSRELKEYLFQRLNEISETDDQFKQRVKQLLKKGGYHHYDYLAQGGLSTAFRRQFMDGGALSTTQEVVGGMLKRGNVHVNLQHGNELKPVFTLGLFSSGLGSFMSSGEEEGGEEEAATGGLELNVLGVGFRPFVFFDGHGELMGHVWSGTASSLTPAYQALILLEDEVIKIPLAIGHYASVTTAVGASVDLSGRIEISLWNRNADSLVQNRAGLAFDTRIDVDASYVKTTAEYNLFSEPELHLTSQIEFSGEIAMCLQLQQPTSSLRYNTYRVERIPGSKHKLRKARYRTVTVPGKTYALNAKNNEMCSVILG